MMSMLCNCCVRELLILARTWFAFGLPSKTGCDNLESRRARAIRRWSTKTAALNLTQRFLSKDLKWERQKVCERDWEVFLKLEMEFKSCSTCGREVGVSIYRWGLKTSRWTNFSGETGCTAPGLTVSLSASLTGRLLHSLVTLTKTGWTAPGKPVSLSAILAGRLLHRLIKLIETGWTYLGGSWTAPGHTCQPDWQTAGQSEKRSQRPVEPLLGTSSTCLDQKV
jgi:hypothetical protein